MRVLIIMTIMAMPYALWEPSSRVPAKGSMSGLSVSGGSISCMVGVAVVASEPSGQEFSRPCAGRA